ncbi:UPF0187-domain-containing protein [Coprinellus micaceus]|uniref:UPF0187-domain-containing protein n=1 Tax=Coprinellus micaceus TaxID=71717 RepID=A0A4Y7TVB1_COPMI|nr:UPF0187-domain-containing protein [Coprinellus micaceus]
MSGPTRSWTGNHHLLPASRPRSTALEVLPSYSLVSWTLGRGSVVWRIWPAVLLHTLFAALITTLCMRGILHLEIPNIMLTVLGVVIGFVISYRASSGYERYWLGRGYWSDIVKHSRTISRLIWFHVPLRLSPKTPEEVQSGQSERSVKEMSKVMAEKKMALDLLHGFALAVKHHLRGEVGIYYEDMYHLIRPLHDHEHTADDDGDRATSTAAHPRTGHRITTKVSAAQSGIPTSVVPPAASAPSPQGYYLPTPNEQPRSDFMIPPINAYGTFDPSSQTLQRSARAPVPSSGQQEISRSGSPASHLSDISSVNQPLLPSSMPPAQDAMSKVSRDLIPFASTWARLKHYFGFHGNETGVCQVDQECDQETTRGSRGIKRHWQGPVGGGLHMKSHPKVAGGGENLPVEIIRCLSEWISVLEDRGTVQGPSIGSMLGGLMSLEDSLTGLERILTTPLPFVYSVHIRHTVWLYLFFLPFQLVNQFGYYTIAGTAMAAFIYLGFVAAGEEIEQPFGYDDNDLDLDLFCKRIIGSDIEHLKTSPALNVYLGPLQEDPLVAHRRSMTLNEITAAGLGKLEDDGEPHLVGSPFGAT